MLAMNGTRAVYNGCICCIGGVSWIVPGRSSYMRHLPELVVRVRDARTAQREVEVPYRLAPGTERPDGFGARVPLFSSSILRTSFGGYTAQEQWHLLG